jgi:hypothetical protein
LEGRASLSTFTAKHGPGFSVAPSSKAVPAIIAVLKTRHDGPGEGLFAAVRSVDFGTGSGAGWGLVPAVHMSPGEGLLPAV